MTNIRHLRAFAAVAEHQHFTNAADAIHISQPALSALIRQLETELGVTLLHRSTRHVELTAIGREFYEVAIKALASFDEALAQVSDYGTLRRGRVTIAALPSLASSVVPLVARDFMAEHPRISVRVLDLPGDDIIDAIRAKRADLGLTYTRPHDDLEAVSVLRDRLVLIGQLQNATPRKRSVHWRSLGSEPIIAMARGTTIRALIDAAAATAKTSLNIVLEPRLIQTALAFAEQGLGSAVLPSTIMPVQSAGSNVLQYELAGPSMTREISLIHLAGLQIPPAARALHEHLRERFAHHELGVAAARGARTARDSRSHSNQAVSRT